MQTIPGLARSVPNKKLVFFSTHLWVSSSCKNAHLRHTYPVLFASWLHEDFLWDGYLLLGMKSCLPNRPPASWWCHTNGLAFGCQVLIIINEFLFWLLEGMDVGRSMVLWLADLDLGRRLDHRCWLLHYRCWNCLDIEDTALTTTESIFWIFLPYNFH